MSLFRCIIAAFILSTALCVPAFAGESSVTGALIEKLRDKGVLTTGEYNDLTRSVSPADEQELSRRLIKKLYQKGVLDEASYAELEGMAATKTAAVHAEPQASPAKPAGAREAVKPVDNALSSIEDGVAKLGSDNVKLKIGFFFQGGFISDSSGYSVASPPTSDMSTTSGNQFFVRRARMFFYGNVLEKLGYRVSFETATSSAILRDAYVTLDYIPYARLTVGQFKVPFGMEGPLALSDLPVANRSMATNFMHAPKLRDKGAMLSGRYDYGTKEEPMAISYDLGVFNGAGFNKTDDNNSKDIGMRVRFNPFLSCLTLGGSWYIGKNRQAGGVDKDWDRWGAELEWRPKHVKGMKVLGEFAWNRQYFDTYVTRDIISTTKLPALGRYAHGYGWYALAAYRLNGFGSGWGFMNGFEPAARYDYLDEDTAVPDNERDRVTMGLNYYLAKDTRLMLNYELIHAEGRLRNRSLQLIDNTSHKLFTSMVQVKF